jgi:hypothetical protein
MIEFDSQMPLFIPSRFITDINIWYFFGPVVGRFLKKEVCCQQIIDFCSDWEPDHELNLSPIILEILDITDGRIEFCAEGYVWCHQDARKVERWCWKFRMMKLCIRMLGVAQIGLPFAMFLAL